MTPEGLRDATFQRFADWTDARLGIGCFTLARHVLSISAVCIMATVVKEHVRDPAVGSLASVYGGVAGGLLTLAAAAVLGEFEGRSAKRAGPVAILPFRHRIPVTVGLFMLTMSVFTAFDILILTCRIVALIGFDARVLRWMVELPVTTVALAWPVGFMFATCVWKRLPRARRRARAHGGRTGAFGPRATTQGAATRSRTFALAARKDATAPGPAGRIA